MKSAPSKSSLPATERRKQSEPDRRRQQSAKSSPTREMAPFFSVFYRGISGISRVTKSQSRGELLEKDGERDGEKAKSKAAQSQGESRKSAVADKPPLPSSKAKGGCANATDGRGAWDRASAKGGGRSRSTADLHAAKAAAAAEGKNWREAGEVTAPGTSAHHTPSKKAVSSAPNSPQQTAASRKWPLGLFSSRTPQSRDSSAVPPQPPPPSIKMPNGLSRHRPSQNGTDEEHPTALSFRQRIRLHKGVRTGKIPMDALHQTYRGGNRKGEKHPAIKGKAVYLSADDIRQLNHDSDYIAEALRTLGDEQPRVARSTPKHAFIPEDPRLLLERQRRHCLYGEEVYDKMVAESLLVCDLLQTHLDDCIAGVRAKSPTALSSPFTTPPGSPFMSRSTSMQPFHAGGGIAKPISRVTISVSPMAQQAQPPGRQQAQPPGRQQAQPPGRQQAQPPGRQQAQPPGRFLPRLPPFPTAAATIAPPEVRITRPSFEGTLLTAPTSPRAERRRLNQFIV